MKKEDKLKEIILEILEEDPTTTNISITLDSHLKNDLGLDSLSLALLTVKIEDEYGIDIFEDGLVFKISDIIEKLNE